MFLFCSEKNRSGPTTLNTNSPSGPSETDAERKARHLAMLRRMGELGMMLMERAAAEAEQESGQKPARPATESRLVFGRLARSVRDTITLEAMIAADKIPASPRYRQTALRQTCERPATPSHPTLNDPRRVHISEYLHDAIEESTLPKPARATLHDQVEPLIGELLENDPGQEHVGAQIAIAICQELGIPFNTHRMQDELLVRPGQTVSEAYRERQAQKSTGPDPP